MTAGWRYRLTSVLGTALLTALTVAFVNLPAVQGAFALVPYFGRPAPVVLSNGALALSVVTTVTVLLAAMWPVFKPRPRRILDTILLTQRRVFLAMIALAALGYFNYDYRLPRSTLMLATAGLFVVLPAFMLTIRRRPQSRSRAVVVGDDPATMRDILAATDLPVLGYVSPPSSAPGGQSAEPERIGVSDGGRVADELGQLQNLGGLSRLDEVLVKHDIDTALLAFAETDRSEFFGTLDACADNGVTAMVHQDHSDDVLTTNRLGSDLVRVDLEPWDWQDYVVKRGFDVVFAAAGLVVLSPLLALIAAAIRLDSPGPVLYSQERTAEFGGTFTVFKFRTMVPEDEDYEPVDDDENERITRVGRILRRTHLDEIPQLWTILVGRMSVVGPRAAWRAEETLLEEETDAWRKRWFVKPGLTGLAQINGVSSTEPETKLRYDIEYIRTQSFWLDMRIVVRQFWQVFEDAVATLRERT